MTTRADAELDARRREVAELRAEVAELRLALDEARGERDAALAVIEGIKRLLAEASL